VAQALACGFYSYKYVKQQAEALGTHSTPRAPESGVHINKPLIMNVLRGWQWPIPPKGVFPQHRPLKYPGSLVDTAFPG
jgi:hypothetical protein